MRLTPPTALALAALCAAPLAAQAPGEASAVADVSCDRACLLDVLGDHMDALAKGDPLALPLASNVRFTENNVLLPVGDGLWDTVSGVDETGLEAADPSTGNAAWFGSVVENGQPAIYAVRIHVANGQIDEIETVVHRKTSLPAPFGDVENMVHDPEFYDILPPGQRSTRERMLAIGDSYFDTVEVNDGQVFAPFADDCGRLENGISTTAAPPGGEGGNAAAIMAGCENQFKLGLYRINKRIRRDFFIVDEERGVAVGRGFFDHANEFDRYLLTNGREMRTALKWPNSITLLEAFRIKNAEIQRIEAVFTYVPYFMHNPFWGEGSTPPHHAPQGDVCDAACLGANASSLMRGFVGNQWQNLPWAQQVGYSENSVGIRVGEGIWATITQIDQNPLIVSDAQTGKSVWIGSIAEHGQPAWAAITMTGAGDAIGDVDALIRRKEYGAPFAEPGQAPQFSVLPAKQRTSRSDMISAVSAFHRAMESHDGTVPPDIDSDCRWMVNGQDMGGCGDAFAQNRLFALEQVRDRKLLAVDETRGLVAASFFEDFPAIVPGDAKPYPRSLQVTAIFRVESGKIARVEAFTSELPYGMKPLR